jgi:hypothetical protein
MFGTIGHDIKNLGDKEIREGLHAHVVSKIWINESGIGEAEYLILNTGPGQVLNTLFRGAKSKLKVSTKATGVLKPYAGGASPGTRTPKPDTFRLQRIDFVLDPGFKDASPELLESNDTDSNTLLNDETINEEFNNMSQELELQTHLNARIQELKDEKNIQESTAVELTEKVNKLTASISESANALAAFTVLGTAEDIAEKLNSLVAFEQIGNAAEINETLEKSLATIDELNGSLDEANASVANQVMSEEMNEELLKYREIGTLEEVDQLINIAEDLQDEMSKLKFDAIASDFNVESDVVESMFDKGMSIDDIKSTLTSISESLSVTDKKKEDKVDDISESSRKYSDDNHQKGNKTDISESNVTSRVSRLMNKQR